MSFILKIVNLRNPLIVDMAYTTGTKNFEQQRYSPHTSKNCPKNDFLSR